MLQGEIWQVYLDPAVGSEQKGNRPAVIISGNALNDNLEVVIVCPITSSVKEYEGHPILLPNKKSGLKKKSEVLVFHVRSISKKRFKKKIGNVGEKELSRIMETLNDLLKY